MEPPNDVTAAAIVEAYHASWCVGNISGMMGWCHEDVSFYLNTGSPDGSALRLYGTSELTAFLAPITSMATSMTVPSYVSYRDGVARAHIKAFLRHRKTGHVLHGSFRQVIVFYGHKILGIEEFHDGAKMRAFWEMVRSDEASMAQIAKED